jgi:hypothetical protein
MSPLRIIGTIRHPDRTPKYVAVLADGRERGVTEDRYWRIERALDRRANDAL